MKKIALTLAATSLLVGGSAYAGTFDSLSGSTVISSDDDQQRRNRHRNRNHPRPSTNEATTSTSGTAITTRHGGRATIDTRGMARGDGTVQSSSEGEVFSSTDREGSEADAFGRSDASAQERRQRRPQ